jgi:hypothetical protein
LSAVDNFSGVFQTTYVLDGGAPQVYAGPFVVTGDGEHTLQFSSEDNAGNLEDVEEITIKIDTTPPVIDISTDAGQYTRVELITFTIVAFDPMPGSGLMSVTAEFEGDIISDGDIIDPFWLDLGVYEFTATAMDFAGNTSTDEGSFELIATLESLSPTVTRLCEELHISKHGICNSLQAKLTNAMRQDERGHTHVVINMLNAFLHELNAQHGKSISEDAYRILEQDVHYVIESLGGTAATASTTMVIEPVVIEPLEPADIEAVTGNTGYEIANARRRSCTRARPAGLFGPTRHRPRPHPSRNPNHPWAPRPTPCPTPPPRARARSDTAPAAPHTPAGPTGTPGTATASPPPRAA